MQMTLHVTTPDAKTPGGSRQGSVTGLDACRSCLRLWLQSGAATENDRGTFSNRASVPTTSVGARDDHPLATLAAGRRLLEHRSLELGPRLVDLLPPPHDVDRVELGPALIFLRCSSGEMNDSPSRPARPFTRM
jgi:hypothetical protein